MAGLDLSGGRPHGAVADLSGTIQCESELPTGSDAPGGSLTMAGNRSRKGDQWLAHTYELVWTCWFALPLPPALVRVSSSTGNCCQALSSWATATMTDDYGTLEQHASAAATAARALDLLRAQGLEPPNGGLSAADVFARARAGESWARQATSETSDYLSMAVASAAILLDPDLIMLGGRRPAQATC
jgi:hypothetical protein